MKFCENCGKPVNENSQFCENCGAKIKKSVITEQPQKNNNSKSSKNRRNIIFAVIGVLVLIFVVSSLFSSFNSEGKIKKDEYLKIYDEAVKKTETANFIQAKVELEKLQDTKSYDGIDIKKDIDMTVQLFGIRNFVSSKDLTEEDIIEELEKSLDKFDKDYKSSNSKIKKASDTFITESKTFLDFLKTYVEAEKYINNQDNDNANKKLEKLKEYKFTTPKFQDMADSKTLDIQSGIHISNSLNKQENSSNSNNSNNTNKNSSNTINNTSNSNRPTIQEQFNRLKSTIESDFNGTLAVNFNSWHRQGESTLRIEIQQGNETYYGDFSYSANGEWLYVEFQDLPGKNYNSYKA